MVYFLCKNLMARNKTVVVLSRGYKSGLYKNKVAILKTGKVIYSTNSKPIFPDEALVIFS